MYGAIKQHLAAQLDEIRQAGLFKGERVLSTPQRAHVGVKGRPDVLNMCANNYLGLADHPEVVKAAHHALDQWGNGMASVRFICGTQEPHKALERAITEFLGTEETILYSSCWDANGGLFETILGPEDAVISDELNHASIIDGIRLCKARRLRYKNNDMADLEARLREASDARFRLIATDGVFSMDGTIANLPAICELADRYDALVMVDDSHACGFLGANGGGTPEYHNVVGRIDILTGTLGKALGGGAGGYTSAAAEIVQMLRQRSRPYLFSNSLPPPIVGASIKSFELLAAGGDLRRQLEANTRYFRAAMEAAGFTIVPGTHPIVPIMFGDAVVAGKMAERLLERGIYVIAFSYPVVPQGKARIRVQMSAAHKRPDLERAVEAFTSAKADMENP
jgi:glycine C-acetyltransferase